MVRANYALTSIPRGSRVLSNSYTPQSWPFVIVTGENSALLFLDVLGWWCFSMMLWILVSVRLTGVLFSVRLAVTVELRCFGPGVISGRPFISPLTCVEARKDFDLSLGSWRKDLCHPWWPSSTELRISLYRPFLNIECSESSLMSPRKFIFL